MELQEISSLPSNSPNNSRLNNTLPNINNNISNNNSNSSNNSNPIFQIMPIINPNTVLPSIPLRGLHVRAAPLP